MRICDEVEGYDTLSVEAQATFDLIYSQVFSGQVDRGELGTRSFSLPYPLKKAEFNAVLDLYEATRALEEYQNFQYRTDDSGVVNGAYCQRIQRTG
ncbi:MAG: hypothetical protein LUG13_08700 [Oscillospiraceae bacterium]|nr:hypothetical protein [Oscillospiraceae bacterium]